MKRNKGWRKPKKKLTQERVRELFDYDETTGILTRRVSAYKKNNAGSEVNTQDSNGYYQVMVDGWTRMVHRVIWCWYYGYDSEHRLDHRDRVKTNNRILNLREITPSCNAKNCGVPRTNKTGVKGVKWVESEGKFQANIRNVLRNTPATLFRSEDFIEVVCHRFAAEQCLNWHTCEGDSSAYKFLKQEGVIK